MAVGASPLPEFPEISGLRLAVVEAGIKYENRKDLVLIEACANASVAGVFTKNAFCAAPVTLCRKHLESHSISDQPRYLVINTGNANAGTGSIGMEHAKRTCKELAENASVDASAVFPFSTGVIGEYLPIDSLCGALPEAFSMLGQSTWADAAEGIMTTDTRPKGAAREIAFGGSKIEIAGISKGAGMIKPNMATMLGFVATDANIAADLLQSLVVELAEASFNRITVDGDTSTNDACMLIATGKSEAGEVSVDHPDFAAFKNALREVFLELAHGIVKDGEGATKFVSVVVEQAKTSSEALEVAYTIAHSPLVKTALFASDPNWGRILAALGRAQIEHLDLSTVDIFLDDVCIVNGGEKSASYTEEAGQRVMDREEIKILVQLGRGDVSETVWTTDFSHEYVTINAEYRT